MQESESQICGIVSTLVHLVEAVRVADLRDQLRVRVHSLEAQPEIRGKIRELHTNKLLGTIGTN